MVFHSVTVLKINLILTTVGQSGYLFPNHTSLIYSEWTLSPLLNTELLHNCLSNWAIVSSLKYFLLQPWSTSLSLIVISRFPARHLLTSPFVSPLLWPKFPFHSLCFYCLCICYCSPAWKHPSFSKKLNCWTKNLSITCYLQKVITHMHNSYIFQNKMPYFWQTI